MRRLARLGASSIVVTIITVEEQIRGRLDVVRRNNTSPRQVQAYTALQATIPHYFQQVPIISRFDQAAYDHFAALRQQRVTAISSRGSCASRRSHWQSAASYS